MNSKFTSLLLRRASSLATLLLFGAATIDFGVNPDAIGFATWILERSTDLESWNPSTPFFQSENPTSLVLVTDSTAPTAPRAFYRFRAEQK